MSAKVPVSTCRGRPEREPTGLMEVKEPAGDGGSERRSQGHRNTDAPPLLRQRTPKSSCRAMTSEQG